MIVHGIDQCTVSAELFLTVCRERDAYKSIIQKLRSVVEERDLAGIKENIRKLLKVEKEWSENGKNIRRNP